MCGEALTPAAAAYLATMRRTSEVCRARPPRVSRRASGGAAAAAAAPPEHAAPGREVAFEGRRGFVAQRHHAHLAALAAHQQLAVARVDVGAAQVDQLLAAQSAAVEQLEDEPVAKGEGVGADDRVADGVDFGGPQGVRQPPPPARAGKILRGVDGEHAARGEKAAERAHGRELAGERGGGVTAVTEVGGVGAHRAAVERVERDAAGVKPFVELSEVGAVGAARRGRGAAHLEAAQELGDQVAGCRLWAVAAWPS